MNETSTALAATAKAGLPAVGQQQMGFADLLGVKDNAAMVAKNTKTGTRYCLLPIASKTKKSMRSAFNLSAGQARARYAQELHQFSTKAFAGVSGAIASGTMAIASVVCKDSGRMTVNLVPMDSVVVHAPVDLAAVEAYLKSHPEDAKLLLGN